MVGPLVALLVCWTGTAFAQTVIQGAWTANQRVRSIVAAGNTIYIGGDFTRVGPITGSAAVLDGTTGEPQQPGNGRRHRMGPECGCRSRCTIGGRGIVYAGGRFGQVGGQPRNHIAALDATSGAATSWGPGANLRGKALAANGGTVYAGGDFTSIGGQSRSRIAAIDASSGAALDWSRDVSGSLNGAGRVRLELLDVSGRVVALLADRNHEAGNHVGTWNVAGRSGRLSPGLYFLRIVEPGGVAVRRLAIIR